MSKKYDIDFNNETESTDNVEDAFSELDAIIKNYSGDRKSKKKELDEIRKELESTKARNEEALKQRELLETFFESVDSDELDFSEEEKKAIAVKRELFINFTKFHDALTKKIALMEEMLEQLYKSC